MLKYLAVLAIWLALGIYLPPRAKAQESADQTTQKSQQASPPSSVTTINNQWNAAETQAAENKPPHWYESSEWALVIVGIITSIVIGSQTVQTKRAAQAAQAGADATEKQSKNMLARERARLSIIFPPPHPARQVWGSLLVDEVPLNLAFDIINDGESHAFNVQASGYIRTNPIEIGEVVPSYGIDIEIPKVIRVADTANPIRIWIAEGKFRSMVVTTSVMDDIKAGKSALQIVGTISYEDVFGAPHHTPFHYLWNVSGQVNDGDWGEDSHWIDHSPAST